MIIWLFKALLWIIFISISLAAIIAIIFLFVGDDYDELRERISAFLAIAIVVALISLMLTGGILLLSLGGITI